MDWQAAIDRQGTALRRVVAVLVAMLGVGPDPAAAAAELAVDRPTLSRVRHRALLSLVRPAEAAARRLVIALALAVPAAPDAAGPDTPQRLTPDAPGGVHRAPVPRRPRRRLTVVRDGVGTGIVLARPGSVHRDPFHLVPAHLAPGPILAGLAAAPAARPPRVLPLPLTDPARRFGRPRRVAPRDQPRIWVAGGREPLRRPPPPRPDDRLDATRLVLRVGALAAALEDLPREAARFRRWRTRNLAAIARAREALDAGPPAGQPPLASTRAATMARARRFPRLSPLRAGRPPGWRRRSASEIQAILADANGLVLDLMARRDTS